MLLIHDFWSGDQPRKEKFHLVLIRIKAKRMKKIINDWSDFCLNRKKFEDGYFYTLFMDEISHEEVNEIYKYFPNSKMLISKAEKFIFEKTPFEKDLFSRKTILERLIKSDFEERKSIHQQIPVFSIFEDNISFTYISDASLISEMNLNDTWSQSFHDFVDFQTIADDKKTYALYDALYCLTTDFDYRLYLFEPLLTTNYTANYIYDFKRLGGVYAIAENGVYYSYTKP